MLTYVLNLYGIKCVELHGKIAVRNWQFALDTFRKSTHGTGPHILILSNVGMVRLNLACVNIMIMVVSCICASSTHTFSYRFSGFHLVSA